MSDRDFSEVSKKLQATNVSPRDAAIRQLFGSSSFFQDQDVRCDRPNFCAKLIIKNKAYKHHEAAKEAVAQSLFEKAVTCFSKAMTLEPEQVQLYVERAEAYLRLCDFQSAAIDLKHACYLEPKNMAYIHRLSVAYYLQGQCLYDQGMFLEALEAFAKAVELRPNFRPYHMRSLACLTALGRYSDCIRLVTDLLDTDTPSADLFTLKARLNHQLKQATLCYYDLKAALRLEPNHPGAQALLGELQDTAELSRQQAVTRTLEGELSEALVLITTAIDHSPEKPEYYLFRGTLYRRLKDFIAAVEDLVLAAEFSNSAAESPESEKPKDLKGLKEDVETQLVLTYNDFALQCISQGFYSEATVLLTKAINEQRKESRLFINRGDCFFKQKEWLFALADYQQAEELEPQNAAIGLRLAIIHNTLGLQSYEHLRFQEAAEKFSVAIKYNPGVAQYYWNRAKAHSRMNNVEDARQDTIRARILNPDNDELLPLLLRLFPGCSLSDVIASDTAQTVKAQLMGQIQAWKLTASPASRLPDKPERTSLLHDTGSPSETHSLGTDDVETKLKPCVSPRDRVKSKEEVIQALKKLLHQRQSLSYVGPRLLPLQPSSFSRDPQRAAGRSYAWRNFGGIGLSC